MSERRGTKALETWCRRLTEGYPGVKVENMTTSWRNGLAFCAIIHHFRPDLIDFASLNPTNIYYNNSLAFNIAERQLGIPALLDAEDMVMYSVPDRLSILTYLSQFYQVFGNQTNSTAGGKQGTSQRIVPKRPALSSEMGMLSAASSSPPTKMPRPPTSLSGSRREPCFKCSFPVFLAERLNVGTRLYHRTCFRCARCNTQLSLANYYETETEEYCCETCPDEEESTKMAAFDSLDNVNSLVSPDTDSTKINRNRSLSDEEKTKGLQQFVDGYSKDFEQTVEDKDQDRPLSKARNHFLSSHLLNEDPVESAEPTVPKQKSLEDLLKSINPKYFGISSPETKLVHTLETKSKEDLNDQQPKDLNSAKPKYLENLNSCEAKSLTQKSLEDLNSPDQKSLDGQNCAELKSVEEQSILSSKDLQISQEDLSSPKALSDYQKRGFETAPKITQQDIQFTCADVLPDSKPADDLSDIPADIKPTDSSLSDAQITDSKDIPPPLPESKPPNSYPADSRDNPPDDLLDKHVDNQVDNQIDIPLNDIKDQRTLDDVSSDLKTSLAAKSVNIPVNIPPEDQRRPASEDKLEEETKDTTQSLVKKRLLIFETGSSKNTNNTIKNVPLTQDISEAHYESVSSEDLDVKYKTVRSDVADSLVLYSSTVSEEPPLNKEENVLSKPILEDISDESSIAFNASLLEDSQEYPEDLNPFGDDLDHLKKIKPSMEDLTIITPPRIEELKKIKPSIEDLTLITPPTEKEKRHSTNPFGSSDEEEPEPLVKQKPPRPPQPAVRTDGKKVVEAPKINLNPFWSDDEDPDNDDVKEKPVPMPRSKHITTPEPRPRKSELSNTASHYDSSSSLSSLNSSFGLTPGRKKKPAPAPPTQGQGLTPEGSKSNSPNTSTHPSPKLTPRIRKNRKAPPPPSSTPFVSTHFSGDNCDISPIIHDKLNQKPDTVILSPTGSDIEKEKYSKDEKNRNRQSQSIPSPVLSDSDSLSISQQCSSSDKSFHGKWKRKKGPAPARPVPQRRQIRPLPLAELRRELDIIEMQQQGLEKQGVKLEQLIREKCEVPGNNDDTALDPEVEDLVLELFELVNEKNELFRRQAELMYLRRQQRLEEEHADLEYQIRCLMDRPERNKTDSDKAREEELINRLLEVVERRNEIVECLEMDRVREAEEDQSINSRLSELASKKDEPVIESPVKLSKKEKKKMKKEKKLKEKGKNLDVDKDIDESETSSVGKEKKKKKWF